MLNKKYKLRCRENGILVTKNPEIYNIGWIREFYKKEKYKIDIDYKNR